MRRPAFFVLVMGLGTAIASGCGARTGSELGGAGGGLADGGASGAAGSDGGAGVSAQGGAAGSAAQGGVSGVGAEGGAAGTIGGQGGVAGSVGGGGFGGNAAGGFGGVGGGCSSAPDCGFCPDCFTACYCQTNDPVLCANACGGAGGQGGFGGSAGFGGAGAGGFGGSAGGCSVAPSCGSCPDCFSACLCQVGDPMLCLSVCGGTGGFGGSGGSAGFGGSAGGTFCGGRLCTDVDVLGFTTLPACCPSSAPNQCGVDTTSIASIANLPPGCQRKNQPGIPDPGCPIQTVPVAGIALAGCCKPNGMCGNDFSLIELGCVDTSPFGGPPATKCGGSGTGGFGGSAGVGGGSGGFGGSGAFGGSSGFGGSGAFGGSSGFGGSGAFGGSSGFGGSAGTGGSSAGCCVAHDTPSCSDANVAACVCMSDPFCCSTTWDGICVSEVESLGCGRCSSGTGGTDGGVGFGGAAGAAGFGGTGVGGSGFGGAGAGGFGGTAGSTGTGGSGGNDACAGQFGDACGKCLCYQCFSQLGACIADFGCPEILDCADRTGCFGSGCYQSGTCRDVIDKFGGPFGQSTQRAMQLWSCAINQACPC